MKRIPINEFSDPRPSKRPRIDATARHTPTKSSPSCFPTPDGFITSSKSSKRPKARIYSEGFQSSFATSSSANKEQCSARKLPLPLPPPPFPSTPPSKRKTLQPLKPSSLVNPFHRTNDTLPSPATSSKKPRSRVVDLRCQTPIKSAPNLHLPNFTTLTTNTTTPRRPPPLPPPVSAAKPTPKLRPAVAPPLPAPKTPPKFTKTILTTNVAKATEFGTEAGNAEVASLMLQSHAVVPVLPLSEEERGLYRSPSKKDGVRPERHVPGGLAARAASLIASTQSAVALWQTDMDRQITGSAKSAPLRKPVSALSRPLFALEKAALSTPVKGLSTPRKPSSTSAKADSTTRRSVGTPAKPLSTPVKPHSTSALKTPSTSATSPSAAIQPPSATTKKPQPRLHPDLRLRIKRIVRAPEPSKGAYAGNVPDKWSAGIAVCEVVEGVEKGEGKGKETVHVHKKRKRGFSLSREASTSHGTTANSHRSATNSSKTSTPNLLTAVLAFDARERAYDAKHQATAYDAKRQAAREVRMREATRAVVREAAAFEVGREVWVWKPFGEARGEGRGMDGEAEGAGGGRKSGQLPARPPVRKPQPPPFGFSSQSEGSQGSSQVQSSQGKEEEEEKGEEGVGEEMIPDRTVFCTRFVILPDPRRMAGDG
ncbi:uncharacterized protein SCHCODRAFT_01123248 [Schizophyllum commune H4-8]|nr:uncharacterized protein SCHCODRAFT_01123248 [Schizophyllum commune H4-8]KAI5896397.1 hypothetical protein SCHCODRAFT_01123248 [Schizophyllum commune H4-8]